MYKLIIRKEDEVISTTDLKFGANKIGRDEETCVAVIDDRSISREHAQIKIDEASIYLENLSKYGKVILENEPVELAEIEPGQIFSIGSYSLQVTEEEEKPQESEATENGEAGPEGEQGDDMSVGLETEAAAEIPGMEGGMDNAMVPVDAPGEEGADTMIPDGMGGEETQVPGEAGDAQPGEDGDSEGQFGEDSKTGFWSGDELIGQIIITSGFHKGKSFRISENEIIIGRSPTANITIKDPKLSRAHCKIVKFENQYRLVDLNSANGTRINGIRILEHPLHNLDTIEIGNTQLQFVFADKRVLETMGDMQLVPAENKDENEDDEKGNLNIEEISRTELEDRIDESLGYTGKSPIMKTFAILAHKNIPVLSPLMAKLIQPKPATPAAGGSAAKRKKIMIMGGSLLGLIVVFSLVSGDPPKQQKKAKKVATAKAGKNTNQSTPVTKAPKQKTNLDTSISRAYYSLPKETQNEIEAAYQAAYQAGKEKKWQVVISETQKIFNYVPKYKDAKKFF